MKIIVICFLVMMSCCPVLQAQDYSGVTGMIHVPTAEMATEGEARIGFYFMNKEFLPDTYQYEGEKYNTTNHFLAITPFPWIEIGYVCTILKVENNDGSVGYDKKDRYFHIKVRPLKEGKLWPAVAIGVQDPGRKVNESYVEGKYPVNNYFQNYYVAASKHILYKQNEFGLHLTYRYFISDFNAKWRGIAAGITYRPSFARNLRAIIEYTGNDINIGADCLLWRYLFLQASLQDGKYFTGGLCFKINLLGNKRTN